MFDALMNGQLMPQMQQQQQVAPFQMPQAMPAMQQQMPMRQDMFGQFNTPSMMRPNLAQMLMGGRYGQT